MMDEYRSAKVGLGLDQSNWEAQRTKKNFDFFRESYYSAIKLATKQPHFSDFIVASIPTFLNACMIMKADPGFLLKVDTTRFLTLFDNLNQLLKIDGAEKALAWLCLDCAKHNTKSSSSMSDTSLKVLLPKWTGEKVTLKENVTIESVVKILYGQAAWELYGRDLQELRSSQDADEFISSILAAELPFTFKNTKIPKFEHSTPIPDNFI